MEEFLVCINVQQDNVTINYKQKKDNRLKYKKMFVFVLLLFHNYRHSLACMQILQSLEMEKNGLILLSIVENVTE